MEEEDEERNDEGEEEEGEKGGEREDPLDEPTPDAMLYVADFGQVERQKRRSVSSTDVTNWSKAYHENAKNRIEERKFNSNLSIETRRQFMSGNRNYSDHNHYFDARRNVYEDHLQSQSLLTITKSTGTSGLNATTPKFSKAYLHIAVYISIMHA